MGLTRKLPLLALLLAGQVLGAGVTYSSYNSPTSNDGNRFTARADWTAPLAQPTVIAKEHGYLTGAIKPGGKYYVYANVLDTGNPPSGVSSSTSNVTALTAGQTTVALSGGSFSVGGISYNRRSNLLTAGSLLGAGSYTYSITSSDVAENTRTQSGLPVTVDATAPAGSDVQASNAPNKTAGRIEQGDQLVLTFSEQIDPHSILSGWDGSAIHVVVRVTQGGLFGFLNDTVTVYDSSNATQLPLGAVDLGRIDYVSSSMTYGEVGAPSRMVQSGATITITLGKLIGGTPNTAAASGTMTWTPSCDAYDVAGNSCATAMAVTETGASDVDF